ncbi:HypC/HybG/HupF family hydrogenase formation chaperone [Pontixanthobacter gangjinensis]|uniref:HypC/HybG/HupF family hydrogenase formation chaperone n=1 Tax=Pontixanthobacter gangjinensis TaxID=1028742 RepID=A0A6I4SN30_9SPHN|nr:HypC/HybG/HupF family hydrogenase formation chaperone [Pontixanthobacter gangjinensis]MXO57301.1 HypC/HybG/HupF family hydrogenase formation chaperone [Pontixanthobacter gangjinensis]
MCLAIPGEVLTVSGGDPLTREGSVAFAGVTKRISLALVPDATIGDFVIVHAGFAIARLDLEEAARTLAMLEAMPPETGS